MKKAGMLVMMLLAFCAGQAWGAALPAVVSTGWLEQNLGYPDHRIVDIRDL